MEYDRAGRFPFDEKEKRIPFVSQRKDNCSIQWKKSIYAKPRPQQVFFLMNGDFFLMNGDFFLMNGDFFLMNGDFLLMNGDFFLMNGDFFLMNGDFF